MSKLYNQPTSQPTQKVAAAGIGGAVSILIIYLVQVTFNTEMPAEVASSITALIAFASGYIVKEKKGE